MQAISINKSGKVSIKEIPITEVQTALDDWRDNPGSVMKILTIF